ncbi:MAG: sulfurtransferase TusA family protein [Candidatus Symbiothrix sp.]|jgi:sulfite reductase (ferredoxin)|nr:sulfurtransferase TusA family protein [Candidatus Symbiothrix sp.]
MSYILPQTLDADIHKFATLAKDYTEKKIDAAQFKAFRVPMGIYEQRKDEVYMSRVRTTGGVISPKQFLEVIEIAKRHRSNLLHITTRQEIQIQNLALEKVEPIMQDLRKIGLATKGGGGNTIRNIIVSEFSGISDREKFDTTPYSMALTTKLIAEPDSYLMPRKMKMAFSSDDTQIGSAAINDAGFVAKIKNGEKGFLVYVGGGAGAKPTVGWKVFDFVPASELYAVTGALKRFFSEYGNRKNRNQARLRFVFYKIGEEETIRLIKQYYDEAKTTEPKFSLPPAENERPIFSYEAKHPQPETKEYNLWKQRYVEKQKQAGYSAVLVPILLGNISLEDEQTVAGLQKLLRFIDLFGEHTIRFTTSQNIRLRNIPDIALPDLFQIIQEFIPDASAPLIVNNIISCTGADTCRLGIGLSKELAKAVRRELLRSNLDFDKFQTTHIRISGCPNSCGLQLWADVGFSGKILRNDRVYPGYQVYLAAHRDDSPKFAEPIGSISSRDIPQFLVRLFESYVKVAKSSSSFTSYLETEGREFALQLIEEYQTIPSFADDKNYYFDWGAETLFSVVGRGAAECAAGLFDMLEIDYNLIKTAKTALEDTTDTEKRSQLLYEIIFSSSRMLLVTRGLDPKTTEDVYNLFINNFIEEGFIDEKYREIVLLARDYKKYDFNLRAGEVIELADKVIELYQSLDDSLQFKNTPVKKQESTTKVINETASERRFKDLRGVACPMNFVQTKIQLASMQSGEELEIWLDDGQPINNVPGSVRNEGHEILEQTPTDGYWKLIIKKK